MGHISLDQMAFYAHHGYYTEERKRGNNYIVNVQLSYDITPAAESDNLADALNYEEVYTICSEEMDKPRHLIESVAKTIADRVKKRFPEIEYVRVELHKLKPELGGPVASATVVYST